MAPSIAIINNDDVLVRIYAEHEWNDLPDEFEDCIKVVVFHEFTELLDSPYLENPTGITFDLARITASTYIPMGDTVSVEQSLSVVGKKMDTNTGKVVDDPDIYTHAMVDATLKAFRKVAHAYNVHTNDIVSTSENMKKYSEKCDGVYYQDYSFFPMVKYVEELVYGKTVEEALALADIRIPQMSNYGINEQSVGFVIDAKKTCDAYIDVAATINADVLGIMPKSQFTASGLRAMMYDMKLDTKAVCDAVAIGVEKHGFVKRVEHHTFSRYGSGGHGVKDAFGIDGVRLRFTEYVNREQKKRGKMKPFKLDKRVYQIMTYKLAMLMMMVQTFMPVGAAPVTADGIIVETGELFDHAMYVKMNSIYNLNIVAIAFNIALILAFVLGAIASRE